MIQYLADNFFLLTIVTLTAGTVGATVATAIYIFRSMREWKD